MLSVVLPRVQARATWVSQNMTWGSILWMTTAFPSGSPVASTFFGIVIFSGSFRAETLPPLLPATLRKRLELVSKFDIKSTFPNLQREFCRQWNDTVDIARIVEERRDRIVSVEILMKLRHAYLALHRDTNSAPRAFPPSNADDDLLTLLSSPSVTGVRDIVEEGTIDKSKPRGVKL